MPSPSTLYGRPRLPRGQVDSGGPPQLRLDAAFERLREVYAGRQKTALPGTSPQYVSSVLHRETPCSLARFVDLLGPLSMAERAFVLGALVEEARPADKPALVEIAEATEAAGEALGFAERLLVAASTSPRDLAELEQRTHRAQRELEDVECAVAGRRP
jgi:hypothetical protein